MGNLLNLATLSLQTYQRALNVTGQNIAGAQNPFYSRQVPVITALPSSQQGSGYLGNGVHLESIQRMADQRLNEQVQQAYGFYQAAEVYAVHAGHLDPLFSHSEFDLHHAFGHFFSAWQTAGAHPDIPAQRDAIIQASDQLVEQIHQLNGRLTQAFDEIDTALAFAASEVSGLAAEIAVLNTEILGNPAPDLLDKRDALVYELGNHISAQVYQQDDGTLTIMMDGTQALVSGGQASVLKSLPDPDNPKQQRLACLASAGPQWFSASTAFQGGQLGGLYQYKLQLLDPMQKQLDALAIGLTLSVNQQHSLGSTQEGQAGGLFFSSINQPDLSQERVVSSKFNQGDQQLSLAIVDTAGLVFSDYQVVVDSGSNYTLIRKLDGLTQSFSSFPLGVDGFVLDSLSGTSVEGDRFLIQPTQGAAASLTRVLTEGVEIALGVLPETSEAFTGSGDGRNGFLMQTLYEKGVFFQGQRSVMDLYTDMVMKVGSKKKQAETSQTYTSLVLQQTQTRRDQLSGVNLDEEASFLLRFEQAYQASAQLIQVANRLFDALLTMVGSR